MKQTILLVEDDAEMSSVLATTLADEGHSVTTAKSRAEAEELSNSAPRPFDLLITDVRLSDDDSKEENGFALADKLVALNPTLPVMFVSGDPDCFASPSIQRFADSPFLKKPFNLEKFVAVVNKLLAKNAG